MSKALILSFNSAVAKYSRLSGKVRKSISKGEFWRYTRRKRNHLLSKLEKLKRRIAELRLRMKLVGAGFAAALLMTGVNEASAQATKIGPFEENRLKNPFPKPQFDRYTDPVPTFWDMENDGDLDVSIGNVGYGRPVIYQNVGTKENPVYNEFYNFDSFSYFYSGDSHGRVVYADVDDDGDLDAIVGMDDSDETSDDPVDDVVYFYRNIASTPEEPPYFQREFAGHPFDNMFIRHQGWPSFTDFDKDGDLDFVLAGEYDDASTGKTAWIQFFRNDKSGHAPGVDITYTKLEGSENPLYLGESVTTITAGFFDITFADLDGDGDEDFFSTDQHGTIRYKRNDDGVFVDQEGEYTHQPNGTSTGNPMEITGLDIAAFDQAKYLGFGDLDGDGDTDLLIGSNAVGTLNSPYIYVENTGNGVMVADRKANNPFSGFNMGDNTHVTFFDYDNDGDKDLIATGIITELQGEEERNVVATKFFVNNNGVYEDKSELTDNPFAGLGKLSENFSDELIIADVDGDGDLDAIFLSRGYDTDLAIDRTFFDYRRNDNGTFVAIPETESPLKVVSDMNEYGITMDFGDLDSDALPDIVLIRNGNFPTFFKNVGSSEAPVFEIPTVIDEDTGTAVPAWIGGLSTEIGGQIPKIVDVDNDGDNDLVLGKYLYIWYYENIGSPTLPRWQEYQQVVENENLENPFGTIVNLDGGGIAPDVADADGDGDKDLLFARWNRGTFEYYENTNPAPTIVSGSALDLTFVAGVPLSLADGFTITDTDADNIVKVTVKIEPYEAGLEKLQIEQQHDGFTVMWDDQTGVLSITGSGAYTDWQDVITDVQYVYTGGPDNEKTSGRSKAPNGRTISKTVSVTTLDADLTIAPSNTISFNLNGDNGVPNVAPSITGTATPFYTSGRLVINKNIVLADTDTVFVGAQVLFTTGHVSSEDELVFDDQNGITGQYNATAGLLTLEGTSSVANYQAALRSVGYHNKSDTPSTDDRGINFIIDDSEAQSTLSGTVIVINKPPVITPPVKRAAASGNIAMPINQLLSDPDDNLDLASLVITSAQGGVVTIANGIVTVNYSAVPNFQGIDVLTITVCDLGGRCNTTTMNVEISADVFVYTGMSPNGDGVNDWFHIDFLPEGTTVAIYDRWGDAVYEESAYDTSDPTKRFEGKNKNGTDLIAGTYYYKVKYPDGRVKAGPLLLNR